MDLMTSITCLFVKLKYAIKNQLKVKLKDGVQEILLRLLPISNDFHSKESSLICIGQKGRETYGTFITFGQKGERVIIGDCWKSIDM